MSLQISISEIIKQAAIDIGLEEPTGTLSTSTNPDIKRLFQYALKTGWELRDDYMFPQLKKQHTITTADADNQYTLPGDFWKMIPDTQWDQTDSWRMSGPLSDQAWNVYSYGITPSTARKKFRIFGANTDSGQFFITPTPSASDTISFDYIRSQWFLPIPWASSTAVTSGEFRSANGNIYTADSTGTTGSTTPSHTTGSASDGTISWTYTPSQTYGTNGRFQADTDICLLDQDLMILGVVWRFLARKGLDYEKDKIDYERLAIKREIRHEGATVLSLANNSSHYNTYNNIPDGSWD